MANKPTECLEHIAAYEMAHLLERHHNARFQALLDGFLPSWRVARGVLNRAPLAHEDRTY